MPKWREPGVGHGEHDGVVLISSCCVKQSKSEQGAGGDGGSTCGAAAITALPSSETSNRTALVIFVVCHSTPLSRPLTPLCTTT